MYRARPQKFGKLASLVEFGQSCVVGLNWLSEALVGVGGSDFIGYVRGQRAGARACEPHGGGGGPKLRPIQYNTYNTIQYIRYNTIHTIQYNTYNTIQHIQYNTIQYIQYYKIKYNNIQYNTIQRRSWSWATRSAIHRNPLLGRWASYGCGHLVL